jgi:hypothetical protein
MLNYQRVPNCQQTELFSLWHQTLNIFTAPPEPGMFQHIRWPTEAQGTQGTEVGGRLWFHQDLQMRLALDKIGHMGFNHVDHWGEHCQISKLYG